MVTASGDPDAAPLVRRFEYSSTTGDVLAASANSIVMLLERRVQININQALLLMAAKAVESLEAGHDTEQVRLHITKMLSPNQVMIGVAEMMRLLELDTGSVTITIREPIPCVPPGDLIVPGDGVPPATGDGRS